MNNQIDRFPLFISQLDQLDLSGIGDSKYQCKSSLKAYANPEDCHGFHVVVAKWDDSPGGQKCFEVWKGHGFSITIICFTIFLLIYGIVAIGVRVFQTPSCCLVLPCFSGSA